jgi:methanogenic corrinoid protein MtbC1
MAQPPALAHLSEVPVFNTKAVARETEVPADTFRAWERRYGVPQPKRTAGGHRLYSERDIAVIRWLRDRTSEGVNISHAIVLLTNTREFAPEGRARAGESRTVARLANELLQALTRYDALTADRLLSEAFSLYPFEQVLIEVVQPTLVEAGACWQRGEINVAAEHFATQFLRRKLASLMSLFEGSGQRATIIAGCAPSEQHDVGMLLSSLFLVRHGWRVIYLGPQVPLADLIETARALRPSLVCLSASIAETALELVDVSRALREALPQTRFGYGGRAFNLNPDLGQAIEGTFMGHDARELVERVGSLLVRSSNGSPVA